VCGLCIASAFFGMEQLWRWRRGKDCGCRAGEGHHFQLPTSLSHSIPISHFPPSSTSLSSLALS